MARFAGVTLPNSAQNADGTLLTATRLQVRVADAINPSSIGQSSNVDVWVDPVAPTLTLMSPAGLCGSFQQSATTVTQTVTFNAESDRVVLQVTNGATTDTYTTPAFAERRRHLHRRSTSIRVRATSPQPRATPPAT